MADTQQTQIQLLKSTWMPDGSELPSIIQPFNKSVFNKTIYGIKLYKVDLLKRPEKRENFFNGIIIM